MRAGDFPSPRTYVAHPVRCSYQTGRLKSPSRVTRSGARLSLFAHSANPNKVRHLLRDHSICVGELASRFAATFGLSEIAYAVGLLHDCGKAGCAWQTGLLRAERIPGPVGLDHKSLGYQLGTEIGLGPFALTLHGHHGGLTADKTARLAVANLSSDAIANMADARSRLNDFLPEAAALKIDLPSFPGRTVLDLAVRMVFSALCDADFLDTEAHFSSRPGPLLRPVADFSVLADRYTSNRRRYLAERAAEHPERAASPMNAAREALYDACVSAAEGPRGMYRVAAGTGAAKTIGAGGFALGHTARHGHKRVIVAVPFQTITEQNAGVYRDLLAAPGEQVVLEHHSGVDIDRARADAPWERTAAENWDAPFVVTTTVQLFNSLFGRKPSVMRKVHRLANSVIVLDEVQALPPRLLVPILDGLRILVEHFGCTVLLSTATQPDFWHLGPFQDFAFTDISVDPAAMAPVAGRVRYVWWAGERPTLAEVAEAAAADGSALVVVGLTKDARVVAEHWRNAMGLKAAWHLSKRMAPAHRRRVLRRVRQRLAEGLPVLLVSTSLIEAGVDVDFPKGYRAKGAADSYVQCAGRVNREGLLAGGGVLVIFDPVDGGVPPGARTLASRTAVRFGPGRADLTDAAAHLAYWGDVYDRLDVEGSDGVGKTVQKHRRRLDFQSVTDGPVTDHATGARDRTKAFRMITDDQISILVPQAARDSEADDGGRGEYQRVKDLIVQVRAGRDVGDGLRALQPYTTTLHAGAVRDPVVAMRLLPVLGDPTQVGSLVEWDGDYDEITGMVLELTVEDLTI
ncbi:CRISPR-associated endonuclease Cas3'' [Phytomonospora sp. NPDC050363]|uniref:CRISPR-associated endonuclease Cas3'' n=1 Tax=Phytomonospora sp. NPDC050363 TaxID=3155642 RepID=UPI003410D441